MQKKVDDVDDIASTLVREKGAEQYCSLCSSRKTEGRMCSTCRDDALNLMYSQGGVHAAPDNST